MQRNDTPKHRIVIGHNPDNVTGTHPYAVTVYKPGFAWPYDRAHPTINQTLRDARIYANGVQQGMFSAGLGHIEIEFAPELASNG